MHQYVPLVIDEAKIRAYNLQSDYKKIISFGKAASVAKPGMLSIVSDLATLIGIAAVVVVVFATSPAVVAAAGTVAIVSGAVVGSIYLCQKYLGCSR